MPDRHEFRAATDQMIEMIDEMRGAEVAKRNVPVGSDAFVELAFRVRDQARLAFRWSVLQAEMAERSAAKVARGEAPDDVILSTVEPRPMDVILAAWREAQMRLDLTEPGSDAARQATDDVERLREEYQAAHAGRQVDADELGTLARPRSTPSRKAG